MDVNENTNKKNKFTVALVIVGVLLVVGIALGLSYAFWIYSTTQSTTNRLLSDCLDITMTDESDAITLRYGFPLRDEEVEELTPYTFKITNKCNSAIQFDVNLEVMSTSESPYATYGVSGRLNSSYIATSFNGGEKVLLSSSSATDPTYSDWDYTAVEAYRVGSGSLAGNTNETYTFKIWMDESVTALDAMNKVFVSKLSVTAVPGTGAICKRATKLYTKTAYLNAYNGWFSGAVTATYGSLGTKGMLLAGDAFDCDVNGDGEFNSETERFYYISDYFDTNTLSFNSDYATLIYSNNTVSGNLNNTGNIPYSNSGTNTSGPVEVKRNLPTTSQWRNVKLLNTTRNILNENNTVVVSNYSYEGYAARLLTVQEIVEAFGTPSYNNGLFNTSSNIFMMDNTRYTNTAYNANYWLENPSSSSTNSACAVSTYDRNYANWYSVSDSIDSYSGNGYGVRPVIEVAKADIDY